MKWSDGIFDVVLTTTLLVAFLGLIGTCTFIVFHRVFDEPNAALAEQAAHEKTLYDALGACLESYEQCREECGR